MKSTELKSIDFKSKLEDCYEDVQPHLESELEKFRNRLIALAEDASDSEKLAVIQKCVESLNTLSNTFDENEDIDGGIDTDEREILCEIIYEMGEIVGLDSNTDYVDEWREW